MFYFPTNCGKRRILTRVKELETAAYVLMNSMKLHRGSLSPQAGFDPATGRHIQKEEGRSPDCILPDPIIHVISEKQGSKSGM